MLIRPKRECDEVFSDEQAVGESLQSTDEMLARLDGTLEMVDAALLDWEQVETLDGTIDASETSKVCGHASTDSETINHSAAGEGCDGHDESTQCDPEVRSIARLVRCEGDPIEQQLEEDNGRLSRIIRRWRAIVG